MIVNLELKDSAFFRLIRRAVGWCGNVDTNLYTIARSVASPKITLPVQPTKVHLCGSDRRSIGKAVYLGEKLEDCAGWAPPRMNLQRNPGQ